MSNVLKDLLWNDYSGNRLIAEHTSDFFVIVPKDDVLVDVPLSCPTCDCLLRSREDESAYLQFECCDWCANQWAYANREKWSAGWRPQEFEIKSALNNRPPLVTVLK